MGSGLENRATHPHQVFPGVPPPPPQGDKATSLTIKRRGDKAKSLADKHMVIMLPVTKRKVIVYGPLFWRKVRLCRYFSFEAK